MKRHSEVVATWCGRIITVWWKVPWRQWIVSWYWVSELPTELECVGQECQFNPERLCPTGWLKVAGRGRTLAEVHRSRELWLRKQTS
jgi:hypothetical protein